MVFALPIQNILSMQNILPIQIIEAHGVCLRYAVTMTKHIIIMGVSGAGKSTVGRAVAHVLARPFIEGDDFHPAANVAKMTSGQALTNTDRQAWIAALCAQANEGAAAVIACSALNVTVRGWLSRGLSRPFTLVYLHGTETQVAARLSARDDHFFDPALLASQFDALDVPDDALVVSTDQTVSAITAQIITALDKDR